MDGFLIFAEDGDEDDPYKKAIGALNPRGKAIQIGASLLLGITAFITFCVLRPRWTGLYAARKKQKDEASSLPELPTSLFGWIVPLWRITDQQVLASAGLDAYAFLQFFKMAIKFLVVTLFFSLLVIKPVHDANPDDSMPNRNGSRNGNDSSDSIVSSMKPVDLFKEDDGPGAPYDFEREYLWMYLVFAYLFSSLAIYLIFSGTKRLVEVRQAYLGAQHSVTDRTMRLSGVPVDLRDEERLKEFIESLDIGKVESVTICQNWNELDTAVNDRMNILRRLEESYTIYLGRKRVERNLESLPVSQPQPPNPPARSASDDDEESATLFGANGGRGEVPYERTRPKTRLRYGFLGFRGKKVDAIDHYEEKLRQIDEKIRALRRGGFTPTPLAFVTMDSVAACQMGIQAVLDPMPQQLIADQSPAPSDVIWANTYLSRRSRIIRAWCVTALIVFLTLFWSVVFVGVAGLLTLESIGKVFPQLPDLVKEQRNLQSLLQTQLPTLIASLLMVLVPYLYYWMSWYQGFISQGDVELSAISKNFFFTFFNFFIVFTISGTGFNFLRFFDQIGKILKRDVWKIAYGVAQSLQGLLNFYVNFIILQGLGLFPFRLLEVGSVSLYPVQRIGAKTPRDYAELVQPPMFNYGFYLPTALLIFIICMVYSVLRESWQVLLAGLIYFALGHFVYKYQLLYAMDNQQQATGRAWVMICDRIFVGLVFFQTATAGQLFLNRAALRGVLMIPLIIATIWTSTVYGRRFKPLMKFISLRSVKIGEQYTDHDVPAPTNHQPLVHMNSSSSTDLAPERRAWAGSEDSPPRSEQVAGTEEGDPTVDPNLAQRKFINPSLVVPLKNIWIADKTLRRELSSEVPDENELV